MEWLLNIESWLVHSCAIVLVVELFVHLISTVYGKQCRIMAVFVRVLLNATYH